MEINGLLYLKAAQRLKMPIILRPEIEGFEIKLGPHRYFFRSSMTPFNNGSSCNISGNKCTMNKILAQAGFPVPKSVTYTKDQYENHPLETLIQTLDFPLVVKPSQGTAHGDDVLCNIKTLAELKKGLDQRYQRHPYLSIEEFHGGLNSYRILVAFHKVIGVVQRFPATVIGDGIHSVQELIELTNKERRKSTLPAIDLDDPEIKPRLKEYHLELNSIIEQGRKIVLNYTCNLYRGGTTISLKKNIHPMNARLFSKASRALNMKLVGFDVECEDILIPLEESKGVIIEANAHPFICIHEKPMQGLPIAATKKILRRLIYRHPLHYFYSLYHKQSTGVYLKISLIILAFFLSFVVQKFL